MLLLCALVVGGVSCWGQVVSAEPEDGKSYVIAAYISNKYYALPNGAVNGGTITGVEITLNSANKVNTSVASGKAWTLEEGTGDNAGQFYIQYKSGSDTYSLYKNGTGKSNYNFAVNKTSKNYWSFTQNGSGYTVTAVDRGTNNTLINNTGGTFSCKAAATPIILLEIGDVAADVTPIPTISGETPFLGSTTVTITNDANASGATIYYTTDGTDPTTSSTVYSAPFDINATTTVKAIAKNGSDTESAVVTKEFTKITPLANIAALTAETTTGTYYVTLTDAVVSYVNGKYAYIKDASGAVVYYANSHTLTAGEVLNGTATVTYELKNANPQITTLTGITPTDGEAPEPTSLKQSEWAYTFDNVLSQYFEITNAIITTSNNKYYVSLGGENVQLYKVGGGFSISDLSKKYTITGFPTLYNTTKELQIFAVPTECVSSDPIIASTQTSLTGFTYVINNGPSAANTFSVSGSNLKGVITLSLGESSSYELSFDEHSGYDKSLTIELPTGGTVGPTTVYVRLKEGLDINASYNGTITLTSTDADNVSVSLSGSVTDNNYTWDLSTDQTTTASESEMTWVNAIATIAAAKGSATTPTNNYYPGSSSTNSSTRFYKSSTLTITPASGCTITSVVFTATTAGYATALENSSWSNANAAAENTTVTVTPENGNNAFSAAIGGTCGFTDIKIYYSGIDVVTGTITDADYTTFVSNKKLDFTNTDIKAYTAICDGDKVKLTEINVVPANTPIVVYKDVNATGTFVVPISITKEANIVLTNDLLASDGSVVGATGIYALGNKTSGVGFYKVKDGETIPAGKCYLNTNASTKEFLGFSIDDDETAINSLTPALSKGEGAIYNIAGQRVSKLQKGINIVGGKKVLK